MRILRTREIGGRYRNVDMSGNQQTPPTELLGHQKLDIINRNMGDNVE